MRSRQPGIIKLAGLFEIAEECMFVYKGVPKILFGMIYCNGNTVTWTRIPGVTSKISYFRVWNNEEKSLYLSIVSGFLCSNISVTVIFQRYFEHCISNNWVRLELKTDCENQEYFSTCPHLWFFQTTPKSNLRQKHS